MFIFYHFLMIPNMQSSLQPCLVFLHHLTPTNSTYIPFTYRILHFFEENVLTGGIFKANQPVEPTAFRPQARLGFGRLEADALGDARYHRGRSTVGSACYSWLPVAPKTFQKPMKKQGVFAGFMPQAVGSQGEKCENGLFEGFWGILGKHRVYKWLLVVMLAFPQLAGWTSRAANGLLTHPSRPWLPKRLKQHDAGRASNGCVLE